MEKRDLSDQSNDQYPSKDNYIHAFVRFFKGLDNLKYPTQCPMFKNP